MHRQLEQVAVIALSLLAFLLFVIFAIHQSHDHDDSHSAATKRLRPKDQPEVFPTPYPIAFRIEFDTNITRQTGATPGRVVINSEVPLRSVLYYNWKLQAQRIDHPAGGYECVRFYNVSKTGCQLYFLPSGMYRVIHADSSIRDITASNISSQSHATSTTTGIEESISCCLDIPGLGAPPPDWARKANPTFRGRVHDSYSGYDAYEFVFDNGGDTTQALPFRSKSVQPTRYSVVGDIYDQYHTAREVIHDDHEATTTSIVSGTPLAFTFPSKAMGLQDFHFDPNSLVVGDQGQDIFRLPDGCDTTRCDGSLPVDIGLDQTSLSAAQE